VPATTTEPAPSTPRVDDGEPSPQQQLVDALDERLGPNGEIDKQLALDMFAAVYGGDDELGATPLSGAVEATTALMLTMEVWDQLTPDQQQVIQAKIDSPVSGSEAGAPAARALALIGTGDYGLEPGALMGPNEDADALVHRQVAAIEALWGTSLPAEVVVQVMDRDLPVRRERERPPKAETMPMMADGTTPAMSLDEYAICRVRLYPAFWGDRTERTITADQIETAAHEVFHCFQDSVISWPDLVHLRSGQLWVIEGQAEWVGATIARGGQTATEWWEVWLTEHQKLWRRSYDAIGFYASLARHGVDPWSVFRPMLLLPRSLAGVQFAPMYAAATPGLPPEFLAQVAVDHASLTAIGEPWLPEGPGVTSALINEPALVWDPIDVPSDRPFDWHEIVLAYDFDGFAVNVADQVVTVTSDTGPWALGGAGAAAFIVSGPGSQSGCAQGDCVCPDGLALDIPHLAADGRLGVGVSTTDTESRARPVNVTVSSVPLDTACTTMPHVPAPTPTPSLSLLGCMVGHWTLSNQTVGDRFVPGLQGIQYRGGVRGRHLDIAPNGAYVMTDDGSDPVTGRGATSGIRVDVIVNLSGRVEGIVERTSPSTATFASNTASIDLHVRETVGGAPVNFDHHFDDAAYFGNGDATVTCDENTMTTAFPNATFSYTKG
jgi:hypothetical protein